MAKWWWWVMGMRVWPSGGGGYESMAKWWWCTGGAGMKMYL